MNKILKDTKQIKKSIIKTTYNSLLMILEKDDKLGDFFKENKYHKTLPRKEIKSQKRLKIIK